MASHFQKVHRIKKFRDWITTYFIWKILIASLRQDDTVEIFRATSQYSYPWFALQVLLNPEQQDLVSSH